jgi:cytochrome c oxidase accessory protein FixG
LEGVFRRIERWIEGPRTERMRRNAGPWNVGKVARKTLKHVLFAATAFAIAHIFLGFFVSAPGVLSMIARPPSEHPEAFAWASITSVILYANFAWFREQLCLIVCPYGRLQSVLTDDDSLVIGYDARRGEPRGKAKDPNAGACVDCNRCVVVCPTGIDIRNGLQIDCIACTACIDACDEVMDKLHRDRGLVRYDSQRAFRGEKKRFWRPRIFLYGALLAIGAVVAFFALRSHEPFEASLLRMRGAPFIVADGTVRNIFQLHLINKGPERAAFTLEAQQDGDQRVTLTPRVELDSLRDREIAVVVEVPAASFRAGRSLVLRVHREGDPPDAVHEVRAALLGPTQ